MPLRDKLQNFNLPDALKAWESSRVGWRIVSYDALRNPPPSLVWFVYLGVLIIACLYLTTTVVVGLHFIKDLFRANSDNLAKSIVMFGSILALPAVLWTAYLGLQQIKISRANQRVDLFMKSTAQLSTAPL